MDKDCKYTQDFLDDLCDPENIMKGLDYASRLLCDSKDLDVKNMHLLIATAALRQHLKETAMSEDVCEKTFNYMFDCACDLIKYIRSRKDM